MTENNNNDRIGKIEATSISIETVYIEGKLNLNSLTGSTIREINVSTNARFNAKSKPNLQ